MAKRNDFELFVDMDGYVCFYSNKGTIYWTLHSYGWEAFYGDESVYETGDVTYPTSNDFQETWDATKKFRQEK